MEGVVGKNCDRCPVNWVLVVNDNRAIRPKWKEPFDYEEGCFPCSTCVSDLMGTANQLSDSLAPVLEVFGGVNSSYLVRTYSSHIFTNPDFSICISCSRHRTTKFPNSESPIFTTKFLF